MKDKLWFFGSARYISVNNFIPDTFNNDGSKGVDDQFIKSANAADDLAGVGRRRSSRRTWTRSTSSAATTCRRCYDPEESATEWNSPAYSTGAAKFTRTQTSRLLFEGGYSRNIEYYTNEYQEGIYALRGTPEFLTRVGQGRAGPRRAEDRAHRCRRARGARCGTRGTRRRRT